LQILARLSGVHFFVFVPGIFARCLFGLPPSAAFLSDIGIAMIRIPLVLSENNTNRFLIGILPFVPFLSSCCMPICKLQGNGAVFLSAQNLGTDGTCMSCAHLRCVFAA
jgi:hypothetical protein